MPFGAVYYDRENAQEESAARMLEKYDALVRYASKSPMHAAIVRGDTEGLLKVADAVQAMSYDLANTPEVMKAKTSQAWKAAGRGGAVRESRPYSLEGQRQAWQFGELQNSMQTWETDGPPAKT